MDEHDLELILYTFDISREEFFSDSKENLNIECSCGACGEIDEECLQNESRIMKNLTINNTPSKKSHTYFQPILKNSKLNNLATKIGNFMKKIGHQFRLPRKQVNFKLPISSKPECIVVDNSTLVDTTSEMIPSQINDKQANISEVNQPIKNQFNCTPDKLKEISIPEKSLKLEEKNSHGDIKVCKTANSHCFKSPTDELINLICGEGNKSNNDNIDNWVSKQLSEKKKVEDLKENAKFTKDSRQVKLQHMLDRIKRNKLPNNQPTESKKKITPKECSTENTTIRDILSSFNENMPLKDDKVEHIPIAASCEAFQLNSNIQIAGAKFKKLEMNGANKNISNKKYLEEAKTVLVKPDEGSQVKNLNQERMKESNNLNSKRTVKQPNRSVNKTLNSLRGGQKKTSLKNKVTCKNGLKKKSVSDRAASFKKVSKNQSPGNSINDSSITSVSGSQKFSKQMFSVKERNQSGKKGSTSSKTSVSNASGRTSSSAVSRVKSKMSSVKDVNSSEKNDDISHLTAAKECSALVSQVCNTGLDRSKFDYAKRILTKRHAEGHKSAELGLAALHSTLPKSVYCEESQPLKTKWREYNEESFLVRMISDQNETNRRVYYEGCQENLCQNEGSPYDQEINQSLMPHNVNDRDVHLDLVHTLRATTGGAMYSSSKLQEIYIKGLTNNMDEQMRREKLRTIKDVGQHSRPSDCALPLNDDYVEPDDPYMVRLYKEKAIATNIERCLKTGEVVRTISDQPNAMGTKLTSASNSNVMNKTDRSIATLEPGIQTGVSIPVTPQKTRFYWVPQDYREFLRACDHPIASEYFPQEEGPPGYPSRCDDLMKTNPIDIKINPKFCGILVREFFHVNLYLRLHPQTTSNYYVMYNIILWGRNSEPVGHHRTPVPIPFLPGTAHHIASLDDTSIMDVLSQNYMVIVFYLTYYERNFTSAKTVKQNTLGWDEFKVSGGRINQLKREANELNDFSHPPPRLTDSSRDNPLHDLSPFWHIPLIYENCNEDNYGMDMNSTINQHTGNTCDNPASKNIFENDEELDLLLETSREMGVPLLGTEEYNGGGPTILCSKCHNQHCLHPDSLIGKPLCHSCKQVGCRVDGGVR